MTKSFHLCLGELLQRLDELSCAWLGGVEFFLVGVHGGHPCVVSAGVSALICWYQTHSDSSG